MCLLGRGFLWMKWTTRILSGFSMWMTAGMTGPKGRPPAWAPCSSRPCSLWGPKVRGQAGLVQGHDPEVAMSPEFPIGGPKQGHVALWPHRDQPGYCWGQVPHPKLGRSRDWVLGPCPAVCASSTVLTDTDRHTPGFVGSLSPSPDTALLTCPVSASLARLIINDLHPGDPPQTWAYPRVQERKLTSKGSDLSMVRLQGPGSLTACGPRVSHNTGKGLSQIS